MKEYIFILGKNKELSLLELISYFIKENLNYKIIKLTEHYLIANLENFDFNKSIHKLGGILKIAEFFDLKDLKIYKNKINYGLSEFYKSEKVINELKAIFKKERVKAFSKKPKKGIIFSPKEAHKLDLELLIFKKRIAKVIVNSRPALYKERDENRPYFDKLKTTSLRLSKILINLSQIKEKEILLDPFVGNGSILQEAMILGINVIGTDIDKDSVDGTIKNLDWIKTKYRLKSDFKIYNLDNKNIDEIIDKVDGVVTEPYFGPFFKKIPKYEVIIKLVKELEEKYYLLLNKLKKIVKKNGIIVFPVPIYKTSNGKIKVNFENIIKELGFNIYSPSDNIKIPIRYSLKGSIIERDIYLLKNN